MIFYFSATGNSKYVASRISKITGDEIIAIDHCMKDQTLTFNAKENENIGIVVPVFTSALPTIVDDFLTKLKLTRDGKGYNFAVVTYGMNAGAADYYLKKSMENKSLPIDSLFSVKYPDSFAPLFDVSNKKKVQKKVEAAEPKIDFVIDKITNKVSGNFIKGKMPHVLAALIHKVGYTNDRITTKFTVSDSCNGCGICAEKCPTDAIKIKDNTPIWIKSHCVLCMGCLHRCPQNAIQYGNTKKHGQYLNPNITV
ncbi:MAG: EFR1 family ferrodoxin [Spirochaetaceae bacterium]|nr:EFR1 family ferrodoxin [Spirochaetaceae bacterium]